MVLQHYGVASGHVHNQGQAGHCQSTSKEAGKGAYNIAAKPGTKACAALNQS